MRGTSRSIDCVVDEQIVRYRQSRMTVRYYELILQTSTDWTGLLFENINQVTTHRVIRMLLLELAIR